MRRSMDGAIERDRMTLYQNGTIQEVEYNVRPVDIPLSRREKQLIQRLRQLKREGCAMLVVDIPAMKWRKVGKAE